MTELNADLASLRVMLLSLALYFGGAGGVAAQQPGVDELSDEPGLEVLRSARDALIVADDFSAALEPAERIVAELEASTDQDVSTDIMRLALVQAELGEFEAAQLNYLKVIELLSDENGESSPTLIQPYQALGRTYIAERRFAEALVALQEAQSISRRSAGLFNVEQSELLDDMTLAHLGVGDTIEARSLQVQRLDNALRRFGEDDPRVIPFHTALGEYYDRSRMRISAKEQYEKAVAIGASKLGERDASVLDSLRRVAAIDLVLGHPSEARDRLRELLSEFPEMDPVQAGLSLAVLGDWALVDEDIELAGDYYGRAYRSLEASDEINPDELFGTPRMLDFVPPLTSVDRGTRSRPWAWGSIDLQFDVSADGRPFNVRTAQVVPDLRIDSDYSRRIRETHFRPRLVAGRPVATEKVHFRHSFRYYVSD